MWVYRWAALLFLCCFRRHKFRKINLNNLLKLPLSSRLTPLLCDFQSLSANTKTHHKLLDFMNLLIHIHLFQINFRFPRGNLSPISPPVLFLPGMSSSSFLPEILFCIFPQVLYKYLERPELQLFPIKLYQMPHTA